MIKLERKNNIVIIICIVIIIGAGYYLYSNYSNIFDNDELIENNIGVNNETKEKLEDNKQDYGKKILIHVSGAVNKEGIVELKEEGRVVDAIGEAGGLKDNACIKDINLAEKLEDGTKIYIPTLEEYNSNKETNSISNSYNIEDSKNNNVKQNKNVKININTATQSELETLPGIGSSTALKIIQYRKENGKFKSIEDIKKVNRYRRKQI